MTRWDGEWCEVQGETSKRARIILQGEGTSVCG